MSKENLIWMYEQADETDQREGLLAYARYQLMMQRIADKYDRPLDRVTAAFCALSPNNDYIGNLRSLISVIEGLDIYIHPDRITISTYNHCKNRAIKYLIGEEEFVTKKRGPKILNFYHNILDPESHEWVTIDGHMVAAYRNEPDMNMKEALVGPGKYKILKAEILELSKEMNIIPNQLQAIIWFTRKRLYKIKYNPIPDMFQCPTDQWGILVPLQDLPVYPIK